MTEGANHGAVRGVQYRYFWVEGDAESRKACAHETCQLPP